MATAQSILEFLLTFAGNLWTAVSGSAQSVLQALNTLGQHWSGWIMGQ